MTVVIGALTELRRSQGPGTLERNTQQNHGDEPDGSKKQ
jgi:hypothetical protein